MITSVLIINTSNVSQKVVSSVPPIAPGQSLDLIGHLSVNDISLLPGLADLIQQKAVAAIIVNTDGTSNRVNNAFDFKALLLSGYNAVTPGNWDWAGGAPSQLSDAVDTIASMLGLNRAGTLPLSQGQSSVTVMFTTPLPAGSQYTVTASFSNNLDAHPQLQQIEITAKTLTGFTAVWSAPLDSANYSLEYKTSTPT